MALLCNLAINAKSADDNKQWIGTWATAVEYTGQGDMPKQTLAGKSVRQIIHVSLGGSTLRMQLSNCFGNAPVEIKSVYIADALSAEAINAKTAKYLTFAGKRNVTIEPGKDVFSDNIKYDLKPLQLLSVTICYGDKVPEHATSHRGSRTTSYMAQGEVKPKDKFEVIEKFDHWYNMAAIDIKGEADVVACLGNSITDGRGTTTNLQNRWTDRMAEALDGKVGVLNLGIGGNAVVRGGLSEPALKRFDRDILGQRGVNTLIIYEGVNDIGGSRNVEQTFKELTEAYETMTKKAHDAGMKVYIATICPFKGNSYYTIFHEACREMVNEWIRNQKVADGVIDFDKLSRSDKDPHQLKPELSDDWLHLNPKGYEEMGKCAAEIFKK